MKAYTSLFAGLAEEFTVQLASALILTTFEAPVEPLKFNWTDDQGDEAERQTYKWKDEYLRGYEEVGVKLPIADTHWQFMVEHTLLQLFKERIKERLLAQGVPTHDRIGAIIDQYLGSAVLCHYARYGDVPKSHTQSAIVTKCVDEVLTQIQRQPLSPRGVQLAKGWKQARESQASAPKRYGMDI